MENSSHHYSTMVNDFVFRVENADAARQRVDIVRKAVGAATVYADLRMHHQLPSARELDHVPVRHFDPGSAQGRFMAKYLDFRDALVAHVKGFEPAALFEFCLNEPNKVQDTLRRARDFAARREVVVHLPPGPF